MSEALLQSISIDGFKTVEKHGCGMRNITHRSLRLAAIVSLEAGYSNYFGQRHRSMGGDEGGTTTTSECKNASKSIAL